MTFFALGSTSTSFVTGASRQQGKSRRHPESRLDTTSSLSALRTHQHHQSEHALYFAACRSIVQVQALIDRKADVDAADEDGWTPLHYAVRDRHVDLITVPIGRLYDR